MIIFRLYLFLGFELFRVYDLVLLRRLFSEWVFRFFGF